MKNSILITYASKKGATKENYSNHMFKDMNHEADITHYTRTPTPYALLKLLKN